MMLILGKFVMGFDMLMILIVVVGENVIVVVKGLLVVLEGFDKVFLVGINLVIDLLKMS